MKKKILFVLCLSFLFAGCGCDDAKEIKSFLLGIEKDMKAISKGDSAAGMCAKIQKVLPKLDHLTDRVREYGMKKPNLMDDANKLADNMDIVYAKIQEICDLQKRGTGADQIQTIARRVYQYHFKDPNEMHKPGDHLVNVACGDDDEESALWLPKSPNRAPTLLEDSGMKSVIQDYDSAPKAPVSNGISFQSV